MVELTSTSPVSQQQVAQQLQERFAFENAPAASGDYLDAAGQVQQVVRAPGTAGQAAASAAQQPMPAQANQAVGGRMSNRQGGVNAKSQLAQQNVATGKTLVLRRATPRREDRLDAPGSAVAVAERHRAVRRRAATNR